MPGRRSRDTGRAVGAGVAAPEVVAAGNAPDIGCNDSDDPSVGQAEQLLAPDPAPDQDWIPRRHVARMPTHLLLLLLLLLVATPCCPKTGLTL